MRIWIKSSLVCSEAKNRDHKQGGAMGCCCWWVVVVVGGGGCGCCHGEGAEEGACDLGGL